MRTGKKKRMDFRKSSRLALCLKISSSCWGRVWWLAGESGEGKLGELIWSPHQAAQSIRQAQYVLRRPSSGPPELKPGLPPLALLSCKRFLFCLNHFYGVFLWLVAWIIQDLEAVMQTLCLLFWGIRLFQVKMSWLSRGMGKELLGNGCWLDNPDECYLVIWLTILWMSMLPDSGKTSHLDECSQATLSLRGPPLGRPHTAAICAIPRSSKCFSRGGRALISTNSPSVYSL